MEGELITPTKGRWSRRTRDEPIEPQPPNGMTKTAWNRLKQMQQRNAAVETTGTDRSGGKYKIVDIRVHGTGEVHRVRIYEPTL